MITLLLIVAKIVTPPKKVWEIILLHKIFERLNTKSYERESLHNSTRLTVNLLFRMKLGLREHPFLKLLIVTLYWKTHLLTTFVLVILILFQVGRGKRWLHSLVAFLTIRVIPYALIPWRNILLVRNALLLLPSLYRFALGRRRRILALALGAKRVRIRKGTFPPLIFQKEHSLFERKKSSL